MEKNGNQQVKDYPAGEFDFPSKSKIQNLCSIGFTVFATVYNHGIYKQNIGGSWVPVNNGIPVINIQSVQNMNTVLYAISTSALYQSLNNGSTWEIAYNGSYFDSGVLIEMFLYNTKIYLADNEIGIYMSSDYGKTWVLRNEGISKLGIRYPTKIDAYNSIIAVNSVDNKRFITTDFGNTWNDFIINDNTINNYVPNDTNFFRLFEYRYLKRNPNDTWKRIFGPNSASRKINNLIAFDTFVIAAASDGIWRTGFNNELIFSNNGNEQNWNLSLTGIECYNLIVNSDRIFAGTSSGIYLSTDKGSTWNQIGLKNNPVKRIISMGSIFLAFTSDGINKSLYKSLDGGSTWIYMRIGLSNISEINLCYDNLVALTYLYKDGKIWKRPFKETIIYQRKAASFPLNIGNKWYYQGGFFEENNDYDGFYGAIKEVTDTLSSGFREITSTYFYPNKVSAKKEYWGFINGKFYYNTAPQIENASVLYSNYLNYDSSRALGTDYFQSWQFITSQLFNISDTTLKYRESWGGHYGGSSNSFIVFPEIGITKTWYYLTKGSYGGTTYDDSTYLIGMLRDGEMLGDTIFNIAAGVEKVNIPKQYILSQNYPNPFNPTTTIRYQIPKSGFVSLKIYDILGKVVATLVNEEKPAGIYEVEFSAGSSGNGANLPSGVYFYKLEAGGNIIDKKLLLLK